MNLEQWAALLGILVIVWGVLKYFFGLGSKRLSSTEKEVLTACAERGEIRILSTDMDGKWVRADSHNFIVHGDPTYKARYLEAFDRILERGFATHEGGFLYRLTGSGFTAARKFKPVRDQTK